MAANSVLLDFSIEPARVNDEAARNDIVKVVKENLEKYLGNLTLIYQMQVEDGQLTLLGDSAGVVVTVRFFNEGLITLNIEYYKKASDEQKISFEVRLSAKNEKKKTFTSHRVPKGKKTRARINLARLVICEVSLMIAFCHETLGLGVRGDKHEELRCSS